MVRDSVANIVSRLRECDFDPRKVGHDLWEARCPVHRGADHSLTITRDKLNHIVLECRGTENCQYMRIVRSLGFTNDHVYAETPDWLISRLSRETLQPAFWKSPQVEQGHDRGASTADLASGSSAAPPPDEGPAVVDVIPAIDDVRRPPGAEAEACSPPASAPGSHRASPSRDVSQLAARTVSSAIDDGSHHLKTREETTDKHSEQVSALRVLASVASKARLFRSNDGRFFVQVPVGDRLEVYGLKSTAFRDWLIHGYLIDRPDPPSQVAIRRAIGVLEARARFDAGIPEVYIRTGRDGDGEGSAYFLDLGDPSGCAIAIGDRGWFAVDRPGVHFRRPVGFLPLPMPSRGGSIDLLRPYVNLTDADFHLMVTWLTAVLRPVGPFPILVLSGEQASAKSTLAKVLRLLIDPHTCIALNPPTSTLNLMATAVNGWLLAYDNISDIPRWLSDALCQLVYGGAVSGRALFTNDDRSFIYAQRPVLLSGIGDFVRWADLKDRCVFLRLPPIPRTRCRGEDEFWKAFHADRPAILGAVLDAIVGGLRELPSVHLAELPRMADYAIWGEAVGRGLGWEPGTFLSTYTDNRKEATLSDLLDSPLGHVLLRGARLIAGLSDTPAKLHAKLTEIVGKKVAASADWPKTTATFSNELRRLAPQLRMHGMSVSFERRHEGRFITLNSERGPVVPPPYEPAKPEPS